MRTLLLLLLAIGLAACGASKQSRALVVGMDLSYPPFETIDSSGNPAGVSVDLAQAFGKWMGQPVRIENIPFVGLIPALQSGRIDMIISSMTDTPERRQSVSFSDPYLTIGLALLCRPGTSITSASDLDLSSRTLAVRQGTTGETWARGHLQHAHILVLDKESSAVSEVMQGRADAFLYDQMSVWQNWQRHPKELVALLSPVQTEHWAIALRKGDDALREKVNAFLRDFRAKGGFEALGNRYLEEQKDAFRQRGIPFYF
jgi:polar amino acid transport system substrate-binding protein